MELILAFMLAPLAVSLIIPRVWLVPFGLLIFFGIAYLWFGESRAQCATCGGPGSALGVVFFALAVAGFVIGMSVRGLIAFHKAAPAPSALQARWATTAIWALLSGAFALCATGLAVIFLNRVFDSGLLTHLGICLLALVWFCWTPIFWREDGGVKVVRYATLHPRSVVRLTGAVVIVLLTGWSVRTISFTVDASELIADGRPYCINTSTAEGLRPARTYWDLSGFLMQADRGSMRHAALVAGDVRAPDWFYWSYRHRAFESDFMGWPVSCEPQTGFAKNLPAMQPAQTGNTAETFWLARGQWRIPAAYRGGGSDRPPTLTFYAKGRDLEPLAASTSTQKFDMKMINAAVRITLCDLEQLHVWQAQNDTNKKVEIVGMESGLEKLAVGSRGSPHMEFQYVARDDAGRISTWLLCHQSGTICQHAFRREGVVVELQHPLSQFAQWKDIQDAAWKRVKSFAVVWPDGQPKACKS